MFEESRSLDDLPLAAYSTGVVEDEADLGADSAAAPPFEPSVPTAQDPEPPAPPPVGAQPGDAAVGPVATPAIPGTVTVVVPVERRRFPALEADVRTWIRDPRALAAGAVVVGILVTGFALVGGTSSGAPTATPSPTPAALAAVPSPGAATLTLSGGSAGTFNLTGSTGQGRSTGDRLEATWTDAAGNSLTLTGVAAAGTRPTGADLVLTWTAVVNGAPVTFTSSHGECILGMAVKPKSVSGSITCTKLRSDDRKLVVGIAGDYRT